MSSSVLPFDEKSGKYFCCLKRIHIRTAAQAVSIALVAGTVAFLIYAFMRPPSVMLMSWVIGAFAVGIYGSLAYAVFREKRPFLLPFLAFQAAFVIILGLIFLVVLLNAMFTTPMLKPLAVDFGGISADVSIADPNIRVYVIWSIIGSVFFICAQCWFFEIIYRFYQFLEDRETSFAFHLEPEFRVA